MEQHIKWQYNSLQWNNIYTYVTNFNGILEYYLQISLTYNGIASTNVTYFNGINTKQLRLSYNNQSDINNQEYKEKSVL